MSNNKRIIYLLAVLAAGAALMAALFGADEPKLYPSAIAVSLMLGWFAAVVD